MIKKTAIAATAIALMGVAAPALASPFGDGDYDWAAQRFQSSLQERGIDAINVAESGDYVRADVKQADGSILVQYFDPDTFAVVTR